MKVARQLTVTDALCEEYMRTHRAYCEELEAFCGGRGIGYLRADTNVPFEDLMLRVLREGGFLR